MFAFGELLLLLFFGYIAYDAAKLTNLSGEVNLLSSVTPRIASDYGHDLQEGHVRENVLLPATPSGKNDVTFMFVVDEDGHLISAPQSPKIKQVYRHLQDLLTDSPESSSGNIIHDDATYVWARAAVPQFEHQVILVRQAHISHANAFFREMGVSLIIAAIIMLWVASWAAMYVSMLIEKLNEQKNILKHRSLHDVLTSLPNRALLNDRLEQLIETGRREPIQFSVCFIDLNRFKDVNDTLGHHVGDELLLEVSKRLKSSLRTDDTVSRLGGDEFALILKNTNKDNVHIITEKLLQEIEVPIQAGGHKLFVSGSMGIAIFPEHGKDVQTLLKKADVAMYAAKRSGSNLEFYSDNLEVFTQQKLTLTHDLREAIDNNLLELYYQPKYNLVSKQVVGVEALLRWNHPDKGYIAPLEIIQLAEHSGLIYSLSKWVMKRAFLDSIKLAERTQDITIAVNLSAHFLQDSKFETNLRDLIHQIDVDPGKIILELTESAMFINSTKIKGLLQRITDLGFRISVDDFGTGYSTLTNLRRLPISELKIDRSFVKKIVTDSGDASIVDAMIGLGGSLDIDVVAEGVESQDVLEVLQKFGCNTIQGYLISEPVPLEKFVEWMATRGKNHLKLVSS